jgi:hypothetical protein
MLLQLAGSVPIRTLAWRANLLTACFGAVAVAILAYTAYRWTSRRAAALVSAAVFATAITTWNESTLAGVHAPTLAVDGALLLLAMRYAWRPSLALAIAAGLLFGLGVTGHLTVLALGPVLLLGFVLGARSASRPLRDASAMVLAFGIGLLPFTYTLAVDRPEQPMNYVHDTLEPGEAPFAVERPDFGQRVQRLVWLVSGEQYIGQDRRTPAVLAHRATHVASVVLLNDLPFVATLFALAGFVLLLLTTGVARGFVLAWFIPALVLAGIGGTERTLHYFFQPCTWLLCGPAVAPSPGSPSGTREQASRRCCSCWRCRCCAIRWRIRQASSPTAGCGIASGRSRRASGAHSVRTCDTTPTVAASWRGCPRTRWCWAGAGTSARRCATSSTANRCGPT